jgi:hypothetical protein
MKKPMEVLVISKEISASPSDSNKERDYKRMCISSLHQMLDGRVLALMAPERHLSVALRRKRMAMVPPIHPTRITSSRF